MAMIVEGDLSSTNSNSGEPCRKRTYHSDASVSCLASITRTGYSVQDKKRVSLQGCSLSANTKFKGVVLQQNGHWGAQIYANHNRVWLGTFNTEVEAAMAYDSAAIKLRNGECQRNFAWTKVTDQESLFLSLYNQEAVLNMIKDGSYQSNFFEFLMSRQDSASKERGRSNNSGRVEQKKLNLLQKQLFQKELTPSDVGKLNRLVIPKNYATKYFPQIVEAMLGGLECNLAPDVQLVFYDENMKPWKFRYCYWKSSQSYVFTRGWNRFVKERLLKANDTIRFYECHDGGNNEVFFRISVDSAESSRGVVENNGDGCVSQPPIITLYDKQQLREENDDIQPQIPEVIDEVAQVVAGCKRIKLFGVCIDVDEN